MYAGPKPTLIGRLRAATAPIFALVHIALAAAAMLACGIAGAGDATLRGRAIVRDGDSLEIGSARIRLWGVDAPELRQTCTRGAARWPCGEAALQALRSRVARHALACEPVDVDPHGRQVARCTVQGLGLNEWLVREGWALDYTRYSGGRYAHAQREAQAARRGIWSGGFEPPEQYRRRKPPR